MRRFQDWPTRMDAWLRFNAQNAHAYGAWDCALMAASHLDNIKGTALYDLHAGKYGNESESAYYLASLGVGGMAGLATSVLGEPLKNPRTAQRGDVAAFETQLGTALGIVDLSGAKILALNPSEKGFIRLPLSLAHTVWRA